MRTIYSDKVGPVASIKRIGRAVVAVLGLGVLLGVGGCSTTMQEVLPDDSPTMLEIYRHHNEATSDSGEAGKVRDTVGHRPLDNGTGDLRAYTRTAGNEIEDLFPRLANPDLVMFVFPHLSGSGTPVPGYSTVFPMYDRVEYALPGEGNY